ncbi:MAG: hypothetical protein H6741_21225 [Alphaproteobacteria bacterium]|nr:hypothetical protein [Alphaproteobacteria bacterium]
MGADRRPLLLLSAVALLATLPALSPAVAWYMDNAPHLLEVALLARDALPAGNFYAWSDGANAGMVVGQHNAPLAWMPLAAAAWAGLPTQALYQLAILASNLVFALGTWRLGLRLLGDARAALLAALLAAVAVPDLLGVAGALGGMWPYRLANGLFLLGLSVAPERRGFGLSVAWGVATVLGHTFTAVVGLGVMALEALVWAARGQRAVALRQGLALGSALALTAFFWGPLLDPALRQVEGFWAMGPVDTLALLLTPLSIMDWVMHGELVPIAGPGAWAFHALALPGAALGLWRWQREALGDAALAWLLLAGVAALILAVAVLHSVLHFGLLGPNPWRHYAWWRTLLALLAGYGLAPWLGALSRAAPLGLGLAALAAGLGVRELEVFRDADRQGLSEAWVAAEAQLPPGRIYHQDSFRRPGAPESLRWSHPGGLLGVRTGRPVLGSWYAVFPLPTLLSTISETQLLFGVPEDQLPPGAEWLHGRLRLYGAAGVISVEPGLAARLSGDPRFEARAALGPYTVFALREPPLPVVGVRPTEGTLLGVDDRGALVRARLGGEGPKTLRVRKTWHPWWQARLDGAPVPVSLDADSGLMLVALSGPGELELRWEDRGRRWRWGWLLGALLALLGLRLGRATEA